MRSKISKIDGFYMFLEQRYAGEIGRLFGATVESPVDPFNRPRHRGDFGLRVPPSQQAMTQFFAHRREALPLARKEAVACRDYAMAKVAYLSGVRAAELCGVRVTDVHRESGQWGRFLVSGKGARGAGPRQREAFLFEQRRERASYLCVLHCAPPQGGGFVMAGRAQALFTASNSHHQVDRH
ncbi:hypothetical protein [Streptacidiphilus sp. EB103A]|uniref:hypothetical protein n=1 Tax=Streptacidiphilus sp. EB103A TaxID=3156275 RepID=UPI003514161C